MAQRAMSTTFFLPSPLMAGLVVLGAIGLGVAAACPSMFRGRHPIFGLGDIMIGGGRETKTGKGSGTANNAEDQDGEAEHQHPKIEPVTEKFRWQDTAPLKLRPFKPTYFITMALRSATPSDLIIMDSNYTQRIQDRRQVIEDHADHVLGCIPGPSGPHDEQHHALYNGSVGGVESVRELYAYLLGNYLPQRYPTLFAVEEEEEGAEVVGESCSTNAGGPLEVGHEEGAAVDRTAREEDVSTSSSGRQTKIMTTTRIFHNKITGARFPAELPPLAPTDTKAAIEALKILGETVEDDLLLLQQDPSSSSSPSPSPLPPAGSGSSGTRDNAGGESAPGAGLHRLVATITCNPSGFDPAEKMGKVLREIHAPVPSYSKIERSMERFFSRLEVGKSSCRVNWSITTNPVLFNLASNHIKEGQQVDEDEEIDVTKAFLRCELQTTTRLPRTRAVLFSFKTFMYPLPELRDEGIGPELADAIEGLRAGNAPGMWVYKGAVRWAEPVCEYLRS